MLFRSLRMKKKNFTTIKWMLGILFILMAVAYWYNGHREMAIESAKQAIVLNPHDQRLMQNLRMIEG